MTTKEMIAVMQAYEDGKEIEFRMNGENKWWDAETPLWDWCHTEYRIKPNPKYVPYDSVTEVEKDKWVMRTSDKVLRRILILDPNDNTVNLYCGWFTLKKLFEDYTYEDGTPCGKKVEG